MTRLKVPFPWGEVQIIGNESGQFIGGTFFVKNMTWGFKESESKMNELAVKYGRIEEFCPNPSGAIGPDRLEAFLKAREAVAPNRQRLETSFEQLTKDRRLFAAIRRGLGVIPQVADYLRARYQALLDAGPGRGERGPFQMAGSARRRGQGYGSRPSSSALAGRPS